MDDDEIRTLVKRLSRPHKSGGRVIEHATIMAEGTGAHEIVDWVTQHDGEPEAAAPPKGTGRGLHAARSDARQASATKAPQRYVLPPGALG